jgi:pentatricopeptide repeat protein
VRAHAAQGGPERVVARQALGPAREQAARSALEQARCWRGGGAERLAGAGASRHAGGADAGGSRRRRTSGGGIEAALAACAGARAVQERSTGAQATQAAGHEGGCGSGRRSWSAQASARKRSCGGGLLCEMRERGGIDPDKYTYATVISGWCKIGRIEDAAKVFDEMLAAGEVKPTAVMYNALIGGR